MTKGFIFNVNINTAEMYVIALPTLYLLITFISTVI